MLVITMMIYIMRIDTKKNDSNHENSDNSDITTCTR